MISSRSKIALLAAIAALTVLPATVARAQQTTGTISGRVTDMSTGQPQSGITVILQGPQGEDAALTDDGGLYSFVNLPVGTYVVRFYNASSSTKVERPDLAVQAGATLRADAAIPSQAAVEETYVIKKRAPAVDVGSARLGMTFGQDYMDNIPGERTFGDLILKAPGAFLESSGGASIAGASALENVYVMDGLNVTGMEYGDIMNRLSNASGGTNLTLDFVRELQLNTGGYSAEFGGAMGGVVNAVTKSGSNEFHGSAFSYWSPYWMSADPKLILKKNSALVGVDKPDFDSTIGLEVGGPIIKNKLFFWVGFSPRFEKSHFFRDVLAQTNDGNGNPVVDDNGDAVTTHVLRTRTKQFRNSYAYGGKIDWLAAPDHRLTVSLFGTPYSSQHTRALTPGGEAVADPRWALQQLNKTNTDVSVKWVSQFWDRRVRLDAGVGLHREVYGDKSPYADLNVTNQMEWWGSNLYNHERIAGCAPQPYTDAAGMPQTFNPCPVDNYHNGGYGQIKNFTGNRWMGDVKGTVIVRKHEIKAGIHAEYNTFDQTRYYSGPLGDRRLVQNQTDGNSYIWNFYSLPKGRYQYQFLDDDPTNGTLSDLMSGQFYQDSLRANVKSVNTAYFLQDTWRPLPNLTADVGVRYENQKVYDFRGDQFLNLNNVGPRFGVVYDPSGEGRSKVYAHYGRFFETVPLNLAARYFGGEGLAIDIRDSTPGACTNPRSNWVGNTSGEWDTCPSVGGAALNGGSTYPIQPNIRGQYHDEIVAGFRRALTDDLVVGADYTHRWLGAVIEDGTATDGTFVLSNPGQISKESLDTVQKQIDAKQMEADATTDPAARKVRESELGELQSKLSNLKGLAQQPKPERTYDALTITANKRIARNWMLNASYTYSRLIGNYNGLYDADNSYFAPNGGQAYDTPELTLNRRGPLANDRPHAGRIDGSYHIPIGKGSLITSLSISAFSGAPRNYISQWYSGVQMNFLLPRGSAGRTPTVTQTDVKIAYRRPLSKNASMEAFIDFFNVFNERTAVQMDDNYTFEMAAPIVNGSVNDLQYAKSVAGLPLTKNPNFGEGIVFQRPFNGRMGLRLLF